MPNPADQLLFDFLVYLVALSGAVGVWLVYCRAAWWWRVTPLLIVLAGAAGVQAGDVAIFTLARAVTFAIPFLLVAAWKTFRSRQWPKLQFGLRELLVATPVLGIAIAVLVKTFLARRIDPALALIATGAEYAVLDWLIVFPLMGSRRRAWLVPPALVAVAFITEWIGTLQSTNVNALDNGFGFIAERVNIVVHHDVLNSITGRTVITNFIWNVCMMMQGVTQAWNTFWGPTLVFHGMLLLLGVVIAVRTLCGFLKSKNVRNWIRLSQLAMVGAILLFPAWRVCRQMERLPYSEPVVRAGENHFAELMATGGQLTSSLAIRQQYFEKGWLAQLPADVVRPVVIANADVMATIHELVRKDCWTPYDPRNYFLPNEKERQQIHVHLILSMLERDQRGDLPGAAAVGFDFLQFAGCLRGGGFSLWEVLAWRCETEALSLSSKYVADIPLDEIPRWLNCLHEMEATRPSQESVHEQGELALRIAYGWPYVLHKAVEQLGQIEQPTIRFDYSFHRTVVLLRLMRGTLAIRAYQAGHGQLPENLDQLVPEFLPEVPDDPYGKGKLIYRREGETYLLYSVGPNGTDDGGHEKYIHADQSPTGDVFLDSFREPWMD
jgi:hypothetical protein